LKKKHKTSTAKARDAFGYLVLLDYISGGAYAPDAPCMPTPLMWDYLLTADSTTFKQQASEDIILWK